MSKNQRKITIWLVMLILVIPCIIYFLKFHGKLSSEREDWTAFATFLALFVGAANLIVFYRLTIQLYDLEEKSKNENQKFIMAIEKPLLIFRSETQNGTQDLWRLVNIGRGPALNIEFGITLTKNIFTKNIINPDNAKIPYRRIKGYSLAGSNDKLDIGWAIYAKTLFALYQDRDGNPYLTIATDHETHEIKNMNKFSIQCGEDTVTEKDLEDFLKTEYISYNYAKSIYSNWSDDRNLIS